MIGIFLDFVVQVTINSSPPLNVIVYIKRFPEIVEFAQSVEFQKSAFTFNAFAAIERFFCADVEIFLNERIVGYKSNFVEAIALAARRNNPQFGSGKAIE